MRTTQMELIKKHFLTGKHLTSLEAIRLYGCTRLADKVFRLKHMGWIIGSETKHGVSSYGQKYTYSEYYLIGFSKGAALNGI